MAAAVQSKEGVIRAILANQSALRSLGVSRLGLLGSFVRDVAVNKIPILLARLEEILRREERAP